MKWETFRNTEHPELKIFQWPNNVGINLTFYIFNDRLKARNSVKCETFANREQTELKILESPNNTAINLIGYNFTDVKQVITCSVRHFEIQSIQNSKSLNDPIMQVMIELAAF